MSILSLINSRKDRYFKENPESTQIDFILELTKGAWRMVMAKVYLRKCTQIGRYVTTFGKPFISNKGRLLIGDEVRILSNVIKSKIYVGKKGQLQVGKNSRLNGVHISAQLRIEIGNNVRIAPYTIILDSDFHDVRNHFSEGTAKPIIIEDDVWVATRSTILKGVRIGKGSVIAAGSIVTRDVPANCIVGGVPAKIIKHLDNSL